MGILVCLGLGVPYQLELSPLMREPAGRHAEQPLPERLDHLRDCEGLRGNGMEWGAGPQASACHASAGCERGLSGRASWVKLGS